MTRQKSERRTVAKGHRKLAPTPQETEAGAKASPVHEEVRQLLLLSETAEEAAQAATVGATARVRTRAGARAAPMSESKRETPKPATINRRPGSTFVELGYVEVVNRPAGGVTTVGPEEPYVNSTSTVP
jgi:hypothetical protein